RQRQHGRLAICISALGVWRTRVLACSRADFTERLAPTTSCSNNTPYRKAPPPLDLIERLGMVLVHRGTMAEGQERADKVTQGVERQRVSANLRGNRFSPAEGGDVEHLDDPGIADRDVETAQPDIEEHHVGAAGDRLGAEKLTGVRMDLED